MRPDGPRPTIVGPDSGPEPPFPLRMKGKVVSGFGRGSKELGIPTANIPVDDVSWIDSIESGIYFGWAGIQLPPEHADLASRDIDENTSPSSTLLPASSPSTAATTTTTTTTTTATPLPAPTTTIPLPSSTSLLPASALSLRHRLYPMVMSIGYNPFYKNTVRSAEVHVLHAFTQDFYGADMAVIILGYIRPEYDYVDVDSLIGDIRFDCEVARRSLAREEWLKLRTDNWLLGEGEEEGDREGQE